MYVLIISGSRYLTEKGVIAVQTQIEISDPDVLIEGGCSGVDKAGADLIDPAKVWTVRAQWRKLGPKAGPIRNLAMLNIGRELLKVGHDVNCLAFPSSKSKGTWHFVRKSRTVGLPLTVIKLAEDCFVNGG